MSYIWDLKYFAFRSKIIKRRWECFEEFTPEYVDKKWEGWHTGNMVGLFESQRLTGNAFRIASIMTIDESCFVLYAGSMGSQFGTHVAPTRYTQSSYICSYVQVFLKLVYIKIYGSIFHFFVKYLTKMVVLIYYIKAI